MTNGVSQPKVWTGKTGQTYENPDDAWQEFAVWCNNEMKLLEQPRWAFQSHPDGNVSIYWTFRREEVG